MKRVPKGLLKEMAQLLEQDDVNEMAIPSYCHPNPLLRWMAWRRVEVLEHVLRQTVQQRRKLGGASVNVADFGCGTGVLFDTLNAWADQAYGIDLNLAPASMLLERWQLSKIQLIKPTAASSRIPTQSLDVIVCAEVLEHIEPLEPTLELFKRLLNPSGYLLTSLPTENRLYRLGRRLAGFSGHYHHSNAASIDRQLIENGFVRLKRISIPLPGPLAIYWICMYALGASAAAPSVGSASDQASTSSRDKP